MQPRIQRFLQKLDEENKTSQFLILVSFLITFLLIRLIVWLQQIGVIPNQTGLVHIHHLVPGIILLIISGYIAISFWSRKKTRRFMAVLFGIGAALTIDEFALWVFLKDVYFEEEGRLSIDAIILTTTIFLLVYLFSSVNHHRFVKKCFRTLKEN